MSSTASIRVGFTADAIETRLRLLELEAPAAEALGQRLQEAVIRPNIDAIVARFCDYLGSIEQFNTIVAQHSDLARLQRTQRSYLLSFGVDFKSAGYFEERRRIGVVHQAIGVSQSLYQCAFRHLQNLLIDYFPEELRMDRDGFDEMLHFVLKISALDISLAVESFCAARLSNLTTSLENERGETERLQKLSVTDHLTKLHNHSYARHCLNAALARAQRDNSPLCVVMADLDHFKHINDTYGHLVGDDVLRIAAARMLAASRAEDQVGRYGGEEFIFILQNTSLDGAEEAAERVRAHLSDNAIQVGDAEIVVTVSMGVSCACRHDTVNSLIERADAALYAAKAAGRNCIRTECVKTLNVVRTCSCPDISSLA